MRKVAILMALMTTAASQTSLAQSLQRPLLATIEVVGDGVPVPLTQLAGNAGRGAAIVANRQVGLCVLCHPIPTADAATPASQGNLAGSIAGAGSRWSEAQLRLRIVDGRKINAASIMPAFHRAEGLSRVGPAWQDKPILDAQQIEDVVAYLVTLK